jgi:hypothetical protein
MADQPPAKPQHLLPPLSQSASAAAPFLYFDEASAFGHMNGVVRVTLETSQMIPLPDNRALSERVIVAHLRMSIPAAISLKNALEGALLMAVPTETGARN